MTTTFTIRGPAEMIAALPYHLGYHPDRALAVLALSGRRLGMVQRFDLVDPAAHTRAELRAIARTVRDAADVLARSRPDHVLLVAYEDEPGEADALLGLVEVELCERDITILDVLVVRDGCWLSLLCADDCCAGQGQPLPDLGSVPAIADFVALGAAPVPSRAALGDLVATGSGEGELVADVRRAVRRRVTRQRGRPGPVPSSAAVAAWRRLLTRARDGVDPERRAGKGVRDAEPDPAEVAALAVSLLDVAWRDAVIAHLCPGSLPLASLDPAAAAVVAGWPDPCGPAAEGGAEAGERRLEAALSRCCQLVDGDLGEVAAALLTVTAHVAWWRGDGAMARVCLDRALAAEPHYRLACLLDRMLVVGVGPTRPTPTST